MLENYLFIPEICEKGLYLSFDGFRVIYALIASFMWLVALLMSLEYMKGHHHVLRYYVFLIITYFATVGVFLSSDLFTTFIFFEVMSFTSYVWVAQEETKEAILASETYLCIAVMAGIVMLMGLFLLYYRYGTLNFNELALLIESNHDHAFAMWPAICILFGFGAKAGSFPLNIWLPKAHPVAPAPASALLSGILTKAGVYGMLFLSCYIVKDSFGWSIVFVVLGIITMFLGALLAFFSIDLKRTMACSSMSQIGFIMIGIGMLTLPSEHRNIAAYGTFLHMINHSLIKLLLFSLAGIIYMNTHSLDLNELRGYGRKKPLIKLLFLVGSCAIAGVPGFSGYISKTLLHEAILECSSFGIYTKIIEYMFIFAGAMTFAYMTKLFVCLFVEENNDPYLQERYDGKRRSMNVVSQITVTISGFVLLVFGLFPKRIMEKVASLGYEFFRFDSSEFHGARYFSPECLKGGVITIFLGLVLYFIVIRKLFIRNGKYVNLWPSWLDMEDMVYKPLLFVILPTIFGFLCRIFDSFPDAMVVLLRKTVLKDSPIKQDRYEGTLFSDFVGSILNFRRDIRNISNKHKGIPVDETNYVSVMAKRVLVSRETNALIRRSLSFGLFLFSIGFLAMMVYLISGAFSL